MDKEDVTPPKEIIPSSKKGVPIEQEDAPIKINEIHVEEVI